MLTPVIESILIAFGVFIWLKLVDFLERDMRGVNKRDRLWFK